MVGASRHSNGLSRHNDKAPELSRGAPGAVCNRIPLLSKCASSSVVAGACVTACPDLTCCYSETLRKTSNGLDNPDPR